MRVTYKASLQRTMIIYFLLIGFASFLVGAEFILDVQSRELRSELIQNFDKLSRNQMQMDDAFHPIQKLRNKAILMVLIVLVVVIIVLTMFIKNITEPLQHMIEVSKEISKGDLSQTIRITAENELAVLGGTINELTSNLQELALLSEGACTASARFIEQAFAAKEKAQPGRHDMVALREEMRSLQSRIHMLLEIIEDFKLYQIEG